MSRRSRPVRADGRCDHQIMEFEAAVRHDRADLSPSGWSKPGCSKAEILVDLDLTDLKHRNSEPRKSEPTASRGEPSHTNAARQQNRSSYPA
jgi:hypothetical protein